LFLNTHDDLPVLKDTFPAQIYLKHAHCTDLLTWSLHSVSRDFQGNLITLYKGGRTGNVVLLFGTRVTNCLENWCHFMFQSDLPTWKCRNYIAVCIYINNYESTKLQWISMTWFMFKCMFMLTYQQSCFLMHTKQVGIYQNVNHHIYFRLAKYILW
jgi:hypothetical protein